MSNAAISVRIDGHDIPPGVSMDIDLSISNAPVDVALHVPLRVLRGVEDGPHMWLSAAIHGDELNGVEIIRRVLNALDPQHMRGLLIAAPIVNMGGFLNQSRYLHDRRDLNRAFPGSARGAFAGRLAKRFMNDVVAHCSYGIDLHTGSHGRINLPQIRANIDDPETLHCADAFAAPALLSSKPRRGTLRNSALKKGIVMLLFEGGEALRFDEHAISVGVAGVLRVLKHLDMISTLPLALEPAAKPYVARTRKWVRANMGGLFHRGVELGERVGKGQILGSITDVFGDRKSPVRAAIDGMVIGCTTNPLVHRGDALVHLARP